jgi:hypothetical protein
VGSWERRSACRPAGKFFQAGNFCSKEEGIRGEEEPVPQQLLVAIAETAERERIRSSLSVCMYRERRKEGRKEEEEEEEDLAEARTRRW